MCACISFVQVQNCPARYQIHLKSARGPIDVVLLNKCSVSSAPVVLPVPPAEEILQSASLALSAWREENSKVSNKTDESKSESLSFLDTPLKEKLKLINPSFYKFHAFYYSSNSFLTFKLLKGNKLLWMMLMMIADPAWWQTWCLKQPLSIVPQSSLFSPMWLESVNLKKKAHNIRTWKSGCNA